MHSYTVHAGKAMRISNLVAVQRFQESMTRSQHLNSRAEGSRVGGYLLVREAEGVVNEGEASL